MSTELFAEVRLSEVSTNQRSHKALKSEKRDQEVG